MTNHNVLLSNGWILEKIRDHSFLIDFECGDEELNDYFRYRSQLHCKELISQTYGFHKEGTPVNDSIAIMDICNDSVKVKELPEIVKSKIQEEKNYPFYPAVKVTRLGVMKELQGQGIGTMILDSLKRLLLRDNRTGCRFITIDAYNTPKTLDFYIKHNDFEELDIHCDRTKRRTIPLVFDLLRLKDIKIQ